MRRCNPYQRPAHPTPSHAPFSPLIPPPPSPVYSNSSFYVPPSLGYDPPNHHLMLPPPFTPFSPSSPAPHHHAPVALQMVSFGAGLDASYMQPSPYHVLEELVPAPGMFIFFLLFLPFHLCVQKY